MAELTQDQIDSAKYDIIGVIGGYVELKRGGKNHHACCPFHKEKSPSFTVNEKKGFFYCFGCGAGGNAIDFVMQYDGLDFRKAVLSINGEIGSSVTPEMVRQRKTIRAEIAKPSDHKQDQEGAERIIERCSLADQHPYLARNNTAHEGRLIVMKSSLIVPLHCDSGSAVNLAAISADGEIRYSAGGISYGATAIIPPRHENVFDGRTVLTIDYAESWRLWWSKKGQIRILCAMSFENARWLAYKQPERFTHVGCAPEFEEEFTEMGRDVIIIDALYKQRA